MKSGGLLRPDRTFGIIAPTNKKGGSMECAVKFNTLPRRSGKRILKPTPIAYCFGN